MLLKYNCICSIHALVQPDGDFLYMTLGPEGRGTLSTLSNFSANRLQNCKVIGIEYLFISSPISL